MSENQNNETLCDFIGEIRSQADEIAKHLGDQHTFVEQMFAYTKEEMYNG